MKAEILNVTEQDILKADKDRLYGRVLVTKSCPLAQAAKRQFKDVDWVCDLGLFDSNDTCLYTLSEDAKKFINDWDRRVVVRPQEFTITKVKKDLDK